MIYFLVVFESALEYTTIVVCEFYYVKNNKTVFKDRDNDSTLKSYPVRAMSS